MDQEKKKATRAQLAKDNEELRIQLQSLKKECAHLQLLLDNLPGNIYWKDTDSRWLGMSKRCGESLQAKGFIKRGTQSEVVGKTDHEIFQQENAEIYRAHDKEALCSDKECCFEEVTELPDGQSLTLLSTKYRLQNEQGEVIGLIGNTIDISHLKAIESDLKEARDKAEAANIAKSEFIENMSHDIRTPLSGIIGLSALLDEELSDFEHRNQIRMLNDSAEQLLSLLNGVLDDIASHAGDAPKIEQTSFSLAILIDSIFQLELPAAQTKDIIMEANIDTAFPEYIKTDRGKLYRILLNLMSNAVKFTEKGNIRLNAKVTSKKDGWFHTEFSVSDTGIGISKKSLNLIFEPFYKATPSYKKKNAGYGIGLHLVKNYIDQLKGKITVHSHEGEGTTITVHLPLKEGQKPNTNNRPALRHFDNRRQVVTIDSAPPNAHSIEENALQENFRAKVLIVEENPIALKALQAVLNLSQCAFQSASSLQQACQICEKERFDFIISELHLKEGQTGAIVQAIHDFEQKNAYQATPIILISAHSEHYLSQQAPIAGIEALERKPISQTMLEQWIKRYGRINAMTSTEKQNRKDAHQYSSFNFQNLRLLEPDKAIEQFGDTNTVKEMMEYFMNVELKKTQLDIARAVHAHDYKKLHHIVHKFKSACLYCATTQLLEYTKTLETLAEQGDWDSILPLYYDHQLCTWRTGEAIQKWLEQASTVPHRLSGF